MIANYRRRHILETVSDCKKYCYKQINKSNNNYIEGSSRQYQIELEFPIQLIIAFNHTHIIIICTI